MVSATRIWSRAIVFGAAMCGASLAVAQDCSISAGKAPPKTVTVFNIVDYGAAGDGRTVNTLALAKTISACAGAGGGTVFVPPGVYVSGPIRLRSHMTLFVEAGATIKASSRLEDYPVEDDSTWGQGSGESVWAGLITASNPHCVTIAGRGTIDGNAMAFHDPNQLHGHVDKQYTRQGDDYMDPKFGTQHGPIAHQQRPGNLVRFFDCHNVHFSNVIAEGESGIVGYGSESSLIRNLPFENVRLKLKDSPLQSAYGGNFDLRAARDPAKRGFAHDIPALYCRWAEGLRIRRLQVAWDDTMPAFFNHAVQLEDVRDVIIDGFEGRQPQRSGAALALHRVAGISIRASKAAAGTDTFIEHKDVTDARLFTNNDMRDAQTVCQPPEIGFTNGWRLPK